ncbi:response regulator transcription factor [Agromyces bauzanensis]
MASTPVTDGALEPVTWRDVVRVEPARLRDRVARMHEDAWSRDPAALLALAASLRSPGAVNPYAAEPYLDAADDLIARGSVDPALGVLAPIVRSVPWRELGQFSRARTLLAMAARELADARLPFAVQLELQALILLHDGVCAMLGGRIDEGRQLLLRALHVAGPQTPAGLRAEASGGLALIELRVGSLRSAEAFLAAGRTAAAEAPAHRLSTAPVRLAEIAMAIEHGAVEGLEERLDVLIAETTGTEYQPLAVAELVRLRGADDDGAVEILQELQLIIREWELPNLPRMMHDDSRIALLVRHHEAVAARAEIARIVPDETHTQCPAIWSARLALDAGEPARAITLLEPCLAMGDAHSPRTATLAMLVAAAAHAMVGDHTTADALFGQALALAAPTGSVRPFGVLPHPQLTALVARAARRTQPRTVRVLLDAIVARFPSGEDVAPHTLSPRERLVLSRLAAGETQQRISFELSVSPNTIKTQVRSIYRKLGVTTREGAIQRARTLGILE